MCTFYGMYGMTSNNKVTCATSYHPQENNKVSMATPPGQVNGIFLHAVCVQ